MLKTWFSKDSIFPIADILEVKLLNFTKILLIAGFLSSSICLARVIPEDVVQSLRSPYSEEEQNLLDADFEYIRQLVFRGKRTPQDRKPIYLATAGGPGARKSTILESYIYNKAEFANTVYVDPDQRALKFMGNTFYDQSLNNFKISQSKDYPSAQKAAYDYWRAGSNYIANALLNEAVAGGYDIAHGTTLTGPHSGALLKKLKDAGYQIVLVLCGAEDELRMDSVRHRNEVQGFYQTDPEDVKEKALLFPQRLEDYFAHADELWIHWSEQLNSPLEPSAYISLVSKKMEVFSKEPYEKFTKKMNLDASKQTSVASWEKIMKKFNIK